jgi:hypothetical protein
MPGQAENPPAVTKESIEMLGIKLRQASPVVLMMIGVDKNKRQPIGCAPA